MAMKIAKLLILCRYGCHGDLRENECFRDVQCSREHIRMCRNTVHVQLSIYERERERERRKREREKREREKRERETEQNRENERDSLCFSRVMLHIFIMGRNASLFLVSIGQRT